MHLAEQGLLCLQLGAKSDAPLVLFRMEGCDLRKPLFCKNCISSAFFELRLKFVDPVTRSDELFGKSDSPVLCLIRRQSLLLQVKPEVGAGLMEPGELGCEVCNTLFDL